MSRIRQIIAAVAVTAAALAGGVAWGAVAAGAAVTASAPASYGQDTHYVTAPPATHYVT